MENHSTVTGWQEMFFPYKVGDIGHGEWAQQQSSICFVHCLRLIGSITFFEQKG